MDSSLTSFFSPTGIVVVGASASPEKLGYGVARNLVASGFPGAIHFVSQNPGQLFGRPLQTDVESVPDPVDLAVLIVPAHAMPDALHACGRRGIHAAILVSAGFREIGPEGAKLEEACVEIARAHGMRILGPNCIGTIDTHVPLDTTFLQPPMPGPGGIGFISHSGAFCAAIIDWSRNQGFGFSQVVSLGNQADVTETEVLPLVADDEHTRVITLYMEGVSDGEAFVRTASSITRHKPVVALKVGRSESAQKAAASHTGALAASDDAFDAAFRKAGIFRADSAEQMFDWARALEVCPLPAGRRAAILTDAGGPGVIAADALEANGLRLAEISPKTQAALKSLLPDSASVGNPVDMLASASPAQYAESLRLLMLDAGIDSVLVILPPPPMFSAESVAEAFIPIIRDAAKPAVVALLGSRGIAAAHDRFCQAQVPTYPFPERAAAALGALARRADYVARSSPSGTDEQRPFQPRSLRADATVESFVEAYRVDILPLKLARTPEEAAAIAAEIGFPLAMKIASPDISHKSDVGGVLLNIMTPSAASIGYTQVMKAVEARTAGARITGVTLQKQAPAGQDVILGVVRDPNFGPMVMFGSGGIEAEAIRDVAFALAPLSAPEAADLMQRTWAGRRLRGFRGIPAADESAVADVLVRLSWLAVDFPEWQEIEINPLRVLAEGALALDIRGRR